MSQFNLQSVNYGYLSQFYVGLCNVLSIYNVETNAHHLISDPQNLNEVQFLAKTRFTYIVIVLMWGRAGPEMS